MTYCRQREELLVFGKRPYQNSAPNLQSNSFLKASISCDTISYPPQSFGSKMEMAENSFQQTPTEFKHKDSILIRPYDVAGLHIPALNEP